MVRRVLVIGHSIVYWAAEYTASLGWGPNLGVEGRLDIKWSGWCRMKWETLLLMIWREAHIGGCPYAIIIQLGENDLPEKRIGAFKSYHA